MIPVIGEAALRDAMPAARAVDVIREAFRADGEGRTRVPAALLLDNGFLTDIRTGAAGAVAADALARPVIDVVGIVGSGLQARWQLRCLSVVRSFTRVVAWSPTRTRLQAYCDEMNAEGYRVNPAADVEEVCRIADVLITATPARQPLVRAEWLRPAVLVTAVGSDSPGKQELEPDCLDRADMVVVDRYAQCAAFGELRHALDAGLLARRDVHAKLGEVVAQRRPARSSDTAIAIADLTGVGFQDTAIASDAFQRLANAG